MEKAEATNVTMGRLVAVVPLANAALSNCTAALLAYVAPRAAIVGVLVPSYMVMVPPNIPVRLEYAQNDNVIDLALAVPNARS